MKWFDNMKINSKMIIGFALIITLLAGMAMFAINRLNKVVVTYDNTIKFPINVRNHILETRAAYNELRRITNTMIALAPLGESERIINLYNDAESTYETIINTIQKFENKLKNDYWFYVNYRNVGWYGHIRH